MLCSQTQHTGCPTKAVCPAVVSMPLASLMKPPFWVVEVHIDILAWCKRVNVRLGVGIMTLKQGSYFYLVGA